MVQYLIHRPVAVPISMFEPNCGGSGGSGGSGSSASGLRPSLHTSANAYDVDMNCDINFHLENQIVRHWTNQGKAC